MTVNIGDSRTNNGFGGDAGTQSNDAEINIGNVGSAGDRHDLRIEGSDAIREVNPSPLAVFPFITGAGDTAELTVGNQFFAWNNNVGTAGSVSSPFLFALNGQPDREGPVNYDIYASFNESIEGIFRPGSGLGQVTITLLPAIDEPSPFLLLGAGLGAAACTRRKWSTSTTAAIRCP